MYIERLLSEFNSSQYSISKKISMTWVISPQVTLSRISSIAKNISVFSFFFGSRLLPPVYYTVLGPPAYFVDDQWSWLASHR